MASKKLFITGATGYIGGSVLEKVVKEFPSLLITAFLRSPSSEFKSRYPDVKIVVGDFDAYEVIEKAASDADIVIHTGDIDHPGCASAILSGLAKKTTPSFLIHLTGTGCISDRLEQTWEGHSNPRVWDDIKDIDDIYNLPDSAFHHAIDKDIINASNDLLKTALICPPDIYGQNTGIGNRATFLVPEYVKALLREKQAFYLGRGENLRGVTHISDVVDLFVILIEQALQGGGKAQWGKEGFYFAVSDEVQWIKVAEAINELGIHQGWLPKDSKAVSWSQEQVKSLLPDPPGLQGLALYLWGSNSRANSARAKSLGWKPRGPSFWDSLREDVEVAVARATAQ